MKSKNANPRSKENSTTPVTAGKRKAPGSKASIPSEEDVMRAKGWVDQNEK